MLNKKGMSPLLLTIILIAFAVALGATIMSWGSSKTQVEKGTCENVELVVQTAFETELVCYNADTGDLRVVVRNAGKSKINSIVYRRINPDMTTRDLTLPSSMMEPGRVYDAGIPFQKEDKIHIEIIPELLINDVSTICDQKAIVREVLPNCPK